MLTQKKISLLILSLLFVCLNLPVQANTNSQKADYIYNFIQYVEWSGGQSNDQVVIGVIGNTEVLAFLEQRASLNTVSKPVKVRSFSNVNELLSASTSLCHILFISEDQNITSPNLEELARKSILLVGEKPGFTQKGGLINFVENRTGALKFEINQSKMINYGFKVSPQLLRIAILAEPSSPSGGVANGSTP